MTGQQTQPAATATSAGQERLLVVDDLKVGFSTRRGDVMAVNGVSFAVEPGKTVAIVGESGSGKSVTARTIMGLSCPPGWIAGGSILLDGQELVGLPDEEMRLLRGPKVAMIFQDPMRSLNPTMKIGRQITESIRLHTDMTKTQARKRSIELLESVRIAAPERRIDEYPHQLSGGMRQRVMIALALSCNPRLLIADEPTTALDVTTQAQILELLGDLQAEFGMAVVLITHDIGVAASYTDDVLVMYAGQIVEKAPTKTLFSNMRMPYTRALFDSIPSLDLEAHSMLPAIKGVPPDLAAAPPGCPFSPRCPRSIDRCTQDKPPLVELAPQHSWACWNPIPERDPS